MKDLFWKSLLKLSGWTADISVEKRDKVVICVAPHTSNWDFIIGLIAYRSVGRKANFLMKEFWFFFPLKYLLTKVGGIPVSRKKTGESLTEKIILKFQNSTYLNLAVTPEGTRKAVDKWKTGFLYISIGSGVPVQLGIIDYKNKKVIIRNEYYPTADIDSDMKYIKNFYSAYKDAARYPDKFTT